MLNSVFNDLCLGCILTMSLWARKAHQSCALSTVQLNFSSDTGDQQALVPGMLRPLYPNNIRTYKTICLLLIKHLAVKASRMWSARLGSIGRSRDIRGRTFSTSLASSRHLFSSPSTHPRSARKRCSFHIACIELAVASRARLEKQPADFQVADILQSACSPHLSVVPLKRSIR